MTRERLLTLLVCLTAAAWFWAGVTVGQDWPARPPEGWSTRATVVGVHDGDTLTVEVRRRVQVRLLDCWAPELKTGEPGARSRSRLRELCEGKEVTLFVPAARDGELWRALTFGRVLGRVWAGPGPSLSEKMVTEGYATRSKQK